MKLHGHLVDIDWDGHVLVARGTNADGRALVNATGEDGRLVLAPTDIEALAFRDAPRMVGGVLRVVDGTGSEHRLHFRRDSRAQFLGLYQELAAAVALAKAEDQAHDDDPGVVDLTSPSAAGQDQVDSSGHDALHV